MNTATQASCSTTEISTPTRAFRLIPAGHFQAIDGRPGNGGTWYLNRAAALKIIEASASRVCDFVIDYEHQTLATAANGNPAPAAGWFHKLEWRDGSGLYVADARWTDNAARMILAREYRYISPVFTFDKSGNVLGIVSCALTNTPALDGLTELAAARRKEGELSEKDLLLEARCKAEWSSSAALRQEFSGLDAYVAYTKADEAGLVGIHTAKPTPAGGKDPSYLNKNLPAQERCKAEWSSSAALRQEFSGLDAYVAYTRATEAGLVKFHTL